MGRRTGWSALLEWSLAFALLALVAASALTIGVFLVPVAVAAFVAVSARNRPWPYLPFGLLIGVGGLLTVIGFMHLADMRCVTPGTVIGAGHAGPGTVIRGGCTALDVRLWLAAGGILTLVGLAGYVAATRQHPRSRTS